MARSLEKPIPREDGLITPRVGDWSADKYNLIWLYDTLFSTGMKNKWQHRVYVDLYAAGGIARVKETNQLVYGSPLLALQVKDPFTKYIFCEEDPELLDALKRRARAIAPDADIEFIPGRCDDNVQRIRQAIPIATASNSVLTLCVADPFNLEMKFTTFASLAERFTDFLVLIMTMDANMNAPRYVSEKSRVDDLLCDSGWRDRWKVAESRGQPFRIFIADEFTACMKKLQYLPPPEMKTIRNTEKNSPMYKLALYSRSERAHYYWNEALKYSDEQLRLDLG
jgi:three-Cys-motif partner protein